jgi:hypothetical protein
MVAEVASQYMADRLIEADCFLVVINTEHRRDVVATAVVESQLKRSQAPDVLLGADLDLGEQATLERIFSSQCQGFLGKHVLELIKPFAKKLCSKHVKAVLTHRPQLFPAHLLRSR